MAYKPVRRSPQRTPEDIAWKSLRLFQESTKGTERLAQQNEVTLGYWSLPDSLMHRSPQLESYTAKHSS
jgi:TfoX/Sxy family transcriptional regulator of competence genes